MSKKIIIAGLIIVILTFYGGMKYNQSKIPARGNFTNFTGGQRGIGTRSGGGVVNGEILSKDAVSITIKIRDGGSKIVFLSATTPITKTVAGSQSDLVVGKQVNTMGTENPDGSVTAKSIQIRQATTTSQ